jgi:hypothetical protein
MAKRTEYVERLSALMVEWDAQIALIRHNAEWVTSVTEIGYSQAFAEFQHKRDEVTVKLQGISCSSLDEWEGLKTGTEKTLGEIRAIFYGNAMKFH